MGDRQVELAGADRAGTRSPSTRTWVLALLLLDLLLVAAFVAHLEARTEDRLHHFAHWRWHGERDRSLMELLGAAQLVVAAALLARTGLRRAGAPVLVGWALLLVLLAADELGRLHEIGSAYLREQVGLPALPGLRPDDTGELAIWFALGIVPLVVLAVTYRRSDARARRDSWRLALWCGVLVGFAVVLDMVYVLVMDDLARAGVVAFVVGESTGELLAITGILLVAITIAARAPGAGHDPTAAIRATPRQGSA